MLDKGRNDVLAAMLFKAAARYCLQHDDSAQILRPLTSKRAYKLILGIETVRPFTSVNDLKTQKEGIYYVPIQPMFPAIDALAFTLQALPLTTKWSYVFIVPISLVDSFTEQAFIRPFKKRSVQIDQFVMGLSMDDVFPQAQRAVDLNLQQAATESMTSKERPPKRRLQRSETSEVTPVAKSLRSREPEHQDGPAKVVRPKSSKKVAVEIKTPKRGTRGGRARRS